MTHPAPGLPVDLPWLNCANGSLDLARDLAGHVVLVYFWTASCVHSRQGLVTLARLQQRFANRGLAIIGVHSGRFAHERGIDAVTAAVERLDVRFPVAVDDGFAAWRMWQATGWPFVALIAAQAEGVGEVVFQGLGEPNARRMVRTLGRLLDDAKAAGTLTDQPFRPQPRPPQPTPTGLRSPTRLAVDGDLLWIADTGNHRVLGVDLASGKVRHAVGSGLPGFADGSGEEAALCRPAGLALLRGQLWIADRGNHLLRTFDPTTGILTTALGTGRRERDCLGGYCARDQGLHGPSDITTWQDPARGPSLLLAQAGGHQLWVVDGDTMVATAVVGTGGFGSLDDRDDHASLAQPEAVSANGVRALWVDAATGALRLYDGGPRETRTLPVGNPESPVLREPCGVAWNGDSALAVDTGGGRIFAVDVDAGTAEALTLSLPLVRPEGIAVRDGIAYIADTGAHRIVRLDLATGTAIELPLRDLPELHAAASERSLHRTWVTGGEMLLRLHLSLPIGAQVEGDSGVEVTVDDNKGGVLAQPVRRVLGVVGTSVALPGVALGTNSGEVLIEAVYLTHTAVEGAWHRRVERWVVQVELAHDGAAVQDLR